MITFKQFLSEEEVNEIKEMLERDCAYFFKESGRRGFLKRGVMKIFEGNEEGEVDNIPYWKKIVRKERRPKDMGRKLHDQVDDWFEKNFKMRARSQAVFCFGQDTPKSVLSQYGKPCIIFPIGEFKYVWSPIVADLYSKIGDDDPEEVEWQLEAARYIDGQLTVGVMTSKEIMIECDAYYAFDLSDDLALRAALDIDIYRGTHK